QRLESTASIDSAQTVSGNLVESTSIPQARRDFTSQLARIGVSSLQRFQNRRQLDDVDRAIYCFQEFASNLPDGHKSKTAALINLATSLMLRFETRSKFDDLLEAITLHEKMIKLTASDDPELPGRLFNLAGALKLRFVHLHDRADIDKSISYYQQATSLTPDGHPNKPMFLTDLGVALNWRFGESKDSADIALAISKQEEAISLIADGNSLKPHVMESLGSSLLERFKQQGDLSDLEKATQYREQAVLLTPDNHPNKGILLAKFGQVLQTRFERLGEVSDIEKAIVIQEQVAALVSDSHPEKPTMLKGLGKSLLSRSERLGNPADIDKAIEMFEHAVSLLPEGYPNRPSMLDGLGVSLTRRFERVGNVTDINRAITILEKTVSLAKPDQPDRAGYLNNLGISLMRRFGRLGKLEDLESAIDNHQQAVQLTPDGHSERALRLNNLATSFMSRFRQQGELSDLNEGISRYEEVVLLTPDGSLDKPMWLNNLGGAFNLRFMRLGQLVDADKAISFQDQAVSLTPDDHPAKSTWLHNLATSISNRYDRLRDASDINRTIALYKRAVELAPEGHSHRPSRLAGLGNSLRTRFDRSHELLDLETAISSHEEAVLLTPDDHFDKPGRLSNLGNSYMSRYLWLDDAEDLETAITAYKKSISLSPENHPELPPSLRHLGQALMYRFIRFDELADIDTSIDTHERAISLIPDDPLKYLCLLGLSHSLYYRYRSQRDNSDLSRQISALLTVAKSSVPGPFVRFSATTELASVISQMKPVESLGAYKQAMNLISSLVWLGQSVKQRYEAVTLIGNLATNATAVAIQVEDYGLALEWAEQGRGVVWNQILKLRTPVDALRDVDPALAERLLEVSQALDRAGTERREEAAFESYHPSELASQTHHRLAEEWETLLERARQIPQFDDLVRQRTIPELLRATHSGCVVYINMHETRCDALVLRPNSQLGFHVPLPSFSRDKAAKMKTKWAQSLLTFNVRERGFKQKTAQPVGSKRQFQDVLALLWTDIARPVLNRLGKAADGELPHITWCTTGPLSFLPLHAAGIYDETEPQSKIFNYVVSSYTPTLSALLVAPKKQEDFRGILAVGQEATIGHSPLPGTVEELNQIQQAAAGVRFTRLESDRATLSAVLDGMADHSWVHLACHASQNVHDPTASAFYLHDGSLDLSAISKTTLHGAGLAFLSACQTATGDEALSEEAVHLAAGMLMSGYPTVIATMWSIQDEHAPLIAERFYKGVLNDQSTGGSRVARALHDAVAVLRANIGEDKFETWVPYIHLGL
ncbi:TPR-like protein, partial [Ceratobasidium sp. AG-I]